MEDRFKAVHVSFDRIVKVHVGKAKVLVAVEQVVVVLPVYFCEDSNAGD